jgi:hypothetical protein
MPNIFREGTTKMKPTVFIAASSAALSGFLGTGLAQATTIPSTISSTLTITTDSHLTGNVACAVTGAPCIKIGANGIKLKLNGFIITGNGGRNSCTLNFTDTEIDTNLKNNVSIQGPGLVRRFNFVDIVVSGNNSMVEGVAITSSCLEGIRVLGSNNEVERNSISRAGLDNSLVGHFAAGIFVSAPGGLNNQALGNINAGDIFDANAPGANTYKDNLCEVSNINICELPNIAGHRNPSSE